MPFPPFTVRGIVAGIVGSGPLLPSVAAYGVVFGLMANGSGLSAVETTVFSALVAAGGAQMASLQVWGDPVPLIAVCLTALAMNSRYLLFGATLRPWLGALPAWQTYPSLFFIGDGNWALAMREKAAGRNDAGFLLGSGLICWGMWVASTSAGHIFGQILGDPRRLGVDFMLAAFFAALVVTFLRRLRDLIPFAVAALAAIAVELVVAGPFYILAGALAGSLAGVIGRHAR